MESTATARHDHFRWIPRTLGLAVFIVLGAGGPANVEAQDETLRYLSANVGSASLECAPFEYKLCKEQDVQDLRNYIESWQPEIVLLSEVYRKDQLTGTAMFGPILPDGYSGVCGESRDRFTGELVDWDAPDASHEHECVAWKTSRFQLVAGSERSAYGRNDGFGQSNCAYDFTGFRVMLASEEGPDITAVTVHPDSMDACRDEEIDRYWKNLATGELVVIGGDWNAESDADLQIPSRFDVNFSRGRHGDLAEHPGDYSAVYVGLSRHFDHSFTSFGKLCTSCGGGAGDLAFGSALGGYDGHPGADGGEGMDHRQILVDLQYDEPHAFWPSYLRDSARSGYNPDEKTARPPYEESWSRNVGSSSDDGLVVAAGLVFVTSSSSTDETLTVTAIDVVTGATRWETEVAGTSTFGAPAEADGVLYVLGREEQVPNPPAFVGVLSTLSVADGTLLSHTELPFEALGEPVVDGQKIYLHSSGGLHALDRESKSVLWSYARPGSGLMSEPVLVNGTLVVGDSDLTLALDSDTGDELWQLPQGPGTWFYDLSASVKWNLVFLPTEEALLALDAATGEVQWTQAYDPGSWSAVNAVTDGDRVYHIRSAFENTRVFVFDARTGSVVHQFPIRYVNGDYTFLTLANDVLYATSNQWDFHPLVIAYDASSGALLWESDDIEASTSPVVVAWGNVLALGIPPFGNPSLRLIAYELDLEAGPELEAFGIDFTVEPSPGEPTTAVAALRNAGDTPTGSFNVKWFLDGVEVAYGGHASLSPGEISTDNVRFEWLPTAGVHTLRFEADVDGDVDEANELNNAFSVEVEVGSGALPDLETGIITFSPPPALGQLTTARVEVVNHGAVEAGPFQVTWYLDGTEAHSERRNTPLPAGGAVAFEHEIDVLDEHLVRVVVDSLDEVIESDESNNESLAVIDPAPGSSRLSLSVSPQVLVTNAEGWYDNNPVEVEAVASCPLGGTFCHDPFVLQIGGGARFYVYEADTGLDVICPIDMGEPYSFRQVETRCESIPGTGDLIVAPGESVSLRFKLWIQPTEAASLQVSAAWGPDAASGAVGIPAASIHPLVVIHGVLGSQDPEDLLVTDQHTMHYRFDPFLGAYRPLFNQLQKMGYEWDKTLYGLTYDWRQNNELSAAHLRAQLSGAVIPRSQALAYVASDGKADLVVHSMGGLVSRAYIQGPTYDNDVNKVIFTATPHKGFPFDYRTWEGMDWSNYLYDAWISAGSTVALTPLMNNVLWPMQVYKKYAPTQPQLDGDCFFLPIAAEIGWPYLKVFYLRDGFIAGHYYCDKDAVAKWAHDGDRGIPSLQQMLPTSDMPQYLTASGGGPPPHGLERNVWLEELNAGVQSLVDNLGGADRLFTIYGDEVPQTDFSYEVAAPFGLTPNLWRHGRVWGGAFGLGESSFGNIEEAANGDDLVPASSACLACGGNPLVPALPAGNDHRIAGATHKGILGHPDVHRVALPSFLAGQGLPFQSPIPFTIAPLVRLAVIYSQCPVNLLVTNSAGQRLGFDPATGEVYREIDNAIYSGPQVEPQFIVLADPDPETLSLLIAGYDSGEYSVRAMMIDGGGIFEFVSFAGTTADGQLDDESIEVPVPTTVPSVEVVAPSVAESSPVAEFTLTLSASVERPVTVDFATVDGTATAPADYQAFQGSLTFEPGETTKTLVVPVHDDAVYERDETFTLVVVNPFNGERTEAVAAIVDDDPPPALKVGDTSLVEGAEGTTTEAVFPIFLSSPSAFPLELMVRTVEGSAGPGDFIGKSGVVTVPPGEEVLEVAITVLGDDLVEGTETFSLEGSECFVIVGAAREPCSFLYPVGTGTIVDDDQTSTGVSLEDAPPVTEPEPGKESESLFRARLTAASALPLVLLYETEDGSATGGEDYAVTRESVTVPPGETEVTIAITVFGDSIAERSEFFFLRLTGCRFAGGSQPCELTRDRARAVIEDGDVRTNYRSIGTRPGILHNEGIAVWTGGNRFAIRGGSLPENVGPGDSFVLAPGREPVELFILSREDSRHLLVQGSVDSPPSGVRYAIRRAYRDLGDWERERGGDLAGERRREVGVVYDDGPFRAKPGFSLLTIEGSNTNERYYMKLTPAPGHGHRGKAGTGVVLDGRGRVKLGIQVRDPYTRIEGLELRGFASEDGAAAIEVRHARHVLLDRLLIHDFRSSRASVVGVKGSFESDFTLRNSIIYDGDEAGVRINRDGGRAVIDNSVVFGMDGRGFHEDQGKMLVRNSISMNNGRGDFAGAPSRQSHNLSSDGTAAGPGSIPFARAERQFSSIAPGREDFHLRPGADALDRGEDRSRDFAHDVDGEPRPAGRGWDIGADERQR